MDTNRFVATLQAAHAAREAARLRHARLVEFKKFCSGATIVFTGLLLAAIYSLLTHQIPN